MGNRLTKIYTRTGDTGSTGMANGSRVAKDDNLVKAIGDIDELNSQLALAMQYAPEGFAEMIRAVQNECFNIGAELAMEQSVIKQTHVDWLEQSLDNLNQSLPALKEFILPGGGLAACHCHLARAVCRRAERTLVALNRQNSLNPLLMAYINRLSDFLFVLARAINREQGYEEHYWQSERLNKNT